jgi:hypothetical protein
MLGYFMDCFMNTAKELQCMLCMLPKRLTVAKSVEVTSRISDNYSAQALLLASFSWAYTNRIMACEYVVTSPFHKAALS